MKRIITILAALMIAAALAFSSCDTTPREHNDKNTKTAYIYSVTGQPLDTVYDVTENYGRYPYRVLVTRDGHRYTLDNATVIVK